MSEPFIGQIIMFGGNFAPRNWAFCDGQLMSINQNTALFSILGTTYGGDGRTTFGLPDLRGRVPMHHGAGTGPGLSTRRLGEKGGTETTTLTVANLPSHNHGVSIAASDGNRSTNRPVGAIPAKGGQFTDLADATGLLGGVSEQNVGGNQAINNVQPFQVVNFIIALFGVFPSRS